MTVLRNLNLWILTIWARNKKNAVFACVNLRIKRKLSFWYVCIGTIKIAFLSGSRKILMYLFLYSVRFASKTCSRFSNEMMLPIMIFSVFYNYFQYILIIIYYMRLYPGIFNNPISLELNSQTMNKRLDK